jgi:hypothetical protein
MARTLRSILGGITELPADNDPVTITHHPDANSLFADMLRAKDDLFRATHAVTEALEEKRRAVDAYQRSSEAMQRLFVDHDLIDLPLPKQMELI